MIMMIISTRNPKLLAHSGIRPQAWHDGSLQFSAPAQVCQVASSFSRPLQRSFSPRPVLRKHP